MKPIYKTVLFALLGSISLHAQTKADIGCLQYRLNADDQTAIVTRLLTLPKDSIVRIPETVTSDNIDYTVVEIENQAFKGSWFSDKDNVLRQVKRFTIPKTVKRIGDNAFDIPGHISGDSEYYDHCELEAITFDEGSQLEQLGRQAFGTTCLSEIDLPEGLKVIGLEVFYRSVNLKRVGLPSTVDSIGESAFNGCTELTDFTLPYGLTSIGAYAFEGCKGLTGLNIPNNLTSIGQNAFSGCYNLESITVGSDNTKYDSRKNCNAIISTLDNKLILGCKNTMIPEGVTTIGESAFYSCTGLTSISIPHSVTAIEALAFSGCYYLTTVSLNSEVLVSNTATMCRYMFGSQVEKYLLGDSIKNIGTMAFYNCTSMTSITLPDGLTSIGSSAFSGCTSLMGITIPDGVTSISENAFVRCTNLESIVVGYGNMYYDSREGCNAIITKLDNKLIVACKNSTIPNGVTSIGKNAFRNCTELTKVSFPASLREVEADAFNGCDNIKEVHISDMDAWCHIRFGNNRSNPTWYAHGLLLNGQPVTDVVVPDDVTELGDFIFKQVESLKSIKLHEGITSIGEATFQGCFGLEDVNFPTSLKIIGNGAFHQCSSLKIPINLSQTEVDSISDVAFYQCYNIPSATLPAMLRYLGERSFGSDTCLVSITSYVADPSILQKKNYTRLPFDNFTTVGYVLDRQPIYQQATLYVPKGTRKAYRSHPAFSKFMIIQEAGQDNDEEYVAELNMADSTLTFKKGFVGRTDNTLTTEIPDTLMTTPWNGLGKNVAKVVIDETFADARPKSCGLWFSGCNNLKTIEGMEHLNTSETTDMYGMFFGCSSLETLDLSHFNTANVQLMSFMFYGCNNLKTIYAGEQWSTFSVKSTAYGGNVFYGCTSLIGGMGTRYDENRIDYQYARIDGGADAPGYFTDISTSGIANIRRDKEQKTATYSIDGQRIDLPKKGIYIIDRKKVIMK